MRKGMSQGISRPAFYDRNPSIQAVTFGSTFTGPHTNTLRASFTVPAGKKAWWSWITMQTRRSTAATTLGQVEAWMSYTPSGGSGLSIARSQNNSNVVPTNADFFGSPQMYFGAGDSISLFTDDGSTGGTVDYNLGAFLTTYDP